MNESELLNTALVSLLVGGGTYAGLRGIRDIGGPPKPKTLDNELEITLPSSRVPKPPANQGIKYANEGFDPNADRSITEILARNAADWSLPVVAGAGGLYGGFRGASALYDHFQNRQIDKEKDEVKNNYITALQHAGTKVGSVNTPNVDKFLEACIDKRAEDGILSGLGHLAGLAGAGVKDIAHNVYESGKDGANQAMKDAAGSAPVGLMAGTAALLGLGTMGTTYYLANRLDENKEEAKRKSNIPTEIRLNVR